MEKDLVRYLGPEVTADILKLVEEYDNYISTFKSKMNDLLKPVDYEVLTGIAYRKIIKEGE